MKTSSWFKSRFCPWFKAATMRAVKTMAQTFLASSAVNAATSLGDVSWGAVLSTVVLAGICSYVTSIGGLPELDGTDVE